MHKNRKNHQRKKFKQDTNEDKEHPELEQQPNETDRHYLQRLDQEVKFALDRARYESKYDVKLVNSEKGDHQFEVKKEKANFPKKNLNKPKFGEIVYELPTLTLPRRSKLNKTKVK
ncbi:unnamed protein product [Rotaria magnacalcarata]|uniref:Uncharacterized protein n=1 Tax=Rotaria magnacalcarata TaxID=392030 RepID=A0A816XE69_9BILA|nr:unnamed protein product [Rotaria magnacalcarata]